MKYPLLSKLSDVGRVPDYIRTESAQYMSIHRDHIGNRVRYVILDCSGTTMDRYVDAPAIVFVEVFKKFGVEISMQEARKPMGLRKDLHIKALTEISSVRKKWRKVHGRTPNLKDVDKMFKLFVPRQLQILKKGHYSKLLPGTANVVSGLKKQGINIGITTGFTREMLDILLQGGRRQGFKPDTSVAGDEVESPRPKPFMVLKNLERMGIKNVGNAMRLTVKVDDTISGVAEGAPLCWSVGVSRWGNYVVDSCEAAQKLSAKELNDKEINAKEKLVKESAGHYVIDDLRFLPEVIEDINKRLSNGETPWMTVF
jgi:phosphonoacetaldehyde hydrolase